MQAAQLGEAVELGLGGPLEKILKRMLGSRGAPGVRHSEAWHEERLQLEEKIRQVPISAALLSQGDVESTKKLDLHVSQTGQTKSTHKYQNCPIINR